MDEVLQPSVITAIADADFEGLVSSALFDSGWSVIARPLDFATLEKSVKKESTQKTLIIYSVDLPGFSDLQLKRLAQINISFLGFADSAGSTRGYSDISPRPGSPEELLAFIRGNIRSPLLRAPMLQTKSRLRAKIIAIGSAGHHTGATTLALNLAQELSQLEKKTLLIDANFPAAAIATLLDLRKISLEDKWRDLSDNLSVSEVTQSNIADFSTRVMEAAGYFDCIVIDLGSLQNIASDLSDRRWSSQVKIWASHFAQELFISAGSDLLQIQRLNELSSELFDIKLPARISIFITHSETPVKKANSQQVDFQPFSPKQVQYLPFDSRLCAAARKERTSLSEINGKAPLRKAIAAIALQITG